MNDACTDLGAVHHEIVDSFIVSFARLINLLIVFT